MFNLGDVVASKRGHDKNKILVVVAIVNGDYVLVANGTSRPVENPKLKNAKHLKFVEANTIITNETISNKEIANKIKTLINKSGGINV